ncbi:WD40 repeat domain-containing protein [Candidatus Poribacteria bacterium]|nr:WD40 repeat domain-containing protein [Candidatus Poribacteria bacterium]MYK95655.1 WD40 repeat domain-containing protein [Candidatus Poribacteria bacterium]
MRKPLQAEAQTAQSSSGTGKHSRKPVISDHRTVIAYHHYQYYKKEFEMKKSIPLYAILLSILSLFLSNGFAQDPTQWQLPEGAKMRIGKGTASDITFTPDGAQFAVTTNIGIWIYDAKTGAEISVLKQPDRGYGKIAFSPDGNVLASATDSNGRGEVQLWDTAAGQLITTLPSPTGISSLFFSEDGTKLACAGSSGRVHVWEIRPETPPVLLTDIRLYFESWSDSWLTELSPDGRFLAITIPNWQDKDFSIQLWDGQTGERLHTLRGHKRSVTALTFSPDSKTLVSGDAYETIRVWDTESGNLQSTLRWRGRTATHALAFSPKGRFLTSGHDERIRLWHYTVGEVQHWDYAIGAYQNIMDLKAHKDSVYRFAFSPDELTLLTFSKDGTIIAWDTTTGNQRFTCEGHQQGLQVLVSYQKFHVVAHNLDETGDLKAECKAYLGEGVRLADWNDLLAYYREGGSMADFITELKIPIEYAHPEDMEAIPNTGYRISRNGELRWQGDRHYFFARHDHIKRADFLAHDNIDNYLLSLGSWFGKGGFALCYGDLNSAEPPPDPPQLPEVILSPPGTQLLDQ